MKNIHAPLVIAATAFLFASGCVKRPSKVLSDDEMASLVADLEIAEGYVQTQTLGDRDGDRLVEYVIEKHGVSREEFDSTMAWYGRNVDIYYDIIPKVEHQLELRRRKASGGDEVNPVTDLWPYSRHAVIGENGPGSTLRFSIPITSLAKGDRVSWKLRMRVARPVSALLGVEYGDGRRHYVSRNISNGRKVEMMLQTDTAAQVNLIFGYLMADRRADLPLWLDSIALGHQPVDSTQYFKISSQHNYYKPRPRKELELERRERARMDSIREAANEMENPGTSADSPAKDHKSGRRPSNSLQTTMSKRLVSSQTGKREQAVLTTSK